MHVTKLWGMLKVHNMLELVIDLDRLQWGNAVGYRRTKDCSQSIAPHSLIYGVYTCISLI